MKLSALVEQFQAIIAQHGNLELMTENNYRWPRRPNEQNGPAGYEQTFTPGCIEPSFFKRDLLGKRDGAHPELGFAAIATRRGERFLSKSDTPDAVTFRVRIEK